jgi:RNA polymerase sigma-70 factor (ECF subfamily)
VHLSQKQFWAVFEACLNHLPPKQARIFMMREFVELDTETICDATGISGNHLFVLLHRCRLRLRACLETRWVNPTESSR